jgi:hypothetical protein
MVKSKMAFCEKGIKVGEGKVGYVRWNDGEWGLSGGGRK